MTDNKFTNLPGHYRFRQLSAEDPIPYELLLLADETRNAIDKYIRQSRIYVISENGHGAAFGVVAVQPITGREWEIKNIALIESRRGQGIGRLLVLLITDIARQQDIWFLLVGTPATGHREIHFYESIGFQRFAIKENFFLENYDRPIVEDGLILKDMIMLKMQL